MCQYSNYIYELSTFDIASIADLQYRQILQK